MGRQLKQGKGWRLGWDPEAPDFLGLVGSDQWALELTAAEFEDFCRLLLQLTETIAQIQEELMAEEAVACEAESDRLWMQVAGYPYAYDLSFILREGRRGEGHWPAAAVPELLQAVQTIKVF